MTRQTFMTTLPVLLLGAASLVRPGSAGAQSGASPRPEDVASPEAIVAAAYEALQRRPGEDFDWQREMSLFLPSARLIPNTEQTGGEFLVFSPPEFRQWVADYYAEHEPIGGPDDRGFQEEQIHAVVERYGDIAHVMSTYQKHYWGSDEILGRGINSFQLVYNDGRWWIAGIVWDEESGAGPIPAEYLARPESSLLERARRFRSLVSEEDFAAARTMMAPDAWRWWEAREGEGRPWTIGSTARGPWAGWELMPDGEIDPTGDHPQRFRRLLNLWRQATNREPIAAG